MRILPAFAVLLLTVLGTPSLAQFKKGTRTAGASIGSAFYSNGNADVSFPAPTTGYTNKATAWGLDISPELGWFISDKTIAGFLLNINPNGTKNGFESGGSRFQQDKVNNFGIGIGGFARNYFGKASGFMPFGQFSLSLGMTNSKTSGYFYGGSGSGAYKNTYTGKSSGGFYTNATLSLGMTKLITPHTGLDLYAGYTYSYNKSTVKTTTLRDDGNNGTIDQTQVSEPTNKFTNNRFMIGAGFRVFFGGQ